MARNAVTPTVFSTRDSTKQLTIADWQAVDTATGCYIDLTGYKGGTLLIGVRRTASNVAGDSLSGIDIQACTVQKFSGYKKGDLTIYGDTNVAAQGVIQWCGPFDLSRFKDSNERININCTRATNVGYIGAILIE